MNCAVRLRRRSTGDVWLGFPLGRGDIPRVDEIPVFWWDEVPVIRLARPRHMVPDRARGKEKEMKALAARTLRSGRAGSPKVEKWDKMEG
jgi:hypothetical protein